MSVLNAEAGKPVHRRGGNPVAWGVYLGTSWTWCIGLFLPILLMRDYGWAGFWVFAIPNVIGAAAMGWFLKSPEASKRFVQKHQGAVAWFTLITVWFHVFWITWLSKSALPMLLPEAGTGFVVAAGLVVGSLLILTLVAQRRDTWAAAVVWLFSMALLVVLSIHPELIESASPWPSATGFPLDLAFVIPVSVFGFMLCPYLDATFHRARREVSGIAGGRLAFGLGFGVFFALMIWLTTQYGPVLASFVDPDASAAVFPGWIGVWLVTHLGLQAVFTVSIHTKELVRLDNTPTVRLVSLAGGALVAVALGVFGEGLRPTVAGMAWIGEMPGHEVIYRVFLSAYALAAPLYVLFGPVARVRDTNRVVTWWGMTLGLVAWTFSLGLIALDEAWLVLGLALILGAFVMLKRRDATTPPRPA